MEVPYQSDWGVCSHSCLIQRFPIKKFVGVTILVWGTVMMSLAATKNFSGLMAGRFFVSRTVSFRQCSISELIV